MDYLVLTKTGGFILGPVSQILGWIMDLLFRFTSSMGILNIGLCIILFTLVVKVLMFPLTIKQQKSSKLMSVMQPELLALYRVIYNIPAYVSSVKIYFMQVVYAITNVSAAADLKEGAGASLLQFATDNNVPLTGVTKIGDLVGVTGEALGNKMVDILYKLNPEQWGELGKSFPEAVSVIAENSSSIEKMNEFFGINLATNPWQGMTPNVAWLIPVLAGLTQWFSAKLMMSNQPQQDENSTSAQMMKQMNVMMPMMSVFF